MTVSLPHDWFPEPLPSNVTIGPRSWVYSAFAFIHHRSVRPEGVRIGADSGIYNGTFFELGPSGEVRIGDFCTLVGAIICTNRRVEIEDFAFIAHEVTIADEGVAAAPFSTEFKSDTALPDLCVRVGRNAWVGARAVLVAPASIGEGAIIGAGAVVDFEVPPYAVVAGNPGRVVGWARPKDVDDV